MNRLRGLRCAVALILALMLVLPMSAAAQEESAGDAQERAVEQVAEHVAEDPVEPAEEATPEPEPEPTEQPDDEQQQAEPEPADTPQPEPEQTPKHQGEPDATKAPERSYGARWADGAFPSQTVNYTDELVIGAGARYQVKASRDIQLSRDGKAVEKLKGTGISYDSSNSACASVDGKGNIRGRKKGSAQLIATVTMPDGSQKQLRKNIKVVDAPEIQFAPDYAVLEDGGKLDLGQHAKVPLLKAMPNVDAKVTYKLTAVDKSNGSKVSLDEKTGKIAVRFNNPGDVYTVTAKSYDGSRATFTLYLGQRADRVEILVSGVGLDAAGRLRMAGGESLPLSAATYAGGALAARQDVTWQLIGGEGIATIDDQGMLVLKDGAVGGFSVVAYAQDGGQASARIDVIIAP